jgi:hypothetical protein
MNMPSLEKILKQVDEDWKEAEAVEITGRAAVPDGNYKCFLKNARVEFSKSSDRLQVAWEMEVVEGKQEGKSVMKFDGLDNDVSMGWMKGTMKVLGMEVPKSITKLPGVFEEFFEGNKDIPINITVRTKDNFTNVYINGLAEEEESKKGKKEKGKEKEEEEEEEEKEKKEKSKKGKSSIKADDLDDMNLEEMLEAAEYFDIAVPKKIRDDKKKVRAYLKELV